MAINPTTPSAAPKQSRQPAELETDDQQLQQQQIDTTVGVVNQQPVSTALVIFLNKEQSCCFGT